MRIEVLASARARHQVQHQSSLVHGLLKLGVDAQRVFSLPHIKGPIVACWGWRNGKILRERGFEVLVMERGYIGDRFSYSSLAWNGLNGFAEFPDRACDGGKRFRELGVDIQPWKSDGNYALILGQVPKDASLKGVDMEPWYIEKAKEINEVYGLNVHFRSHPDLKRMGMRQVIPGTIQSEGSLEEALSGAVFSVCFNSNSSVDSILSGVPCVVGDEGSMASEMCSRSIKKLIRPDREKWAWGLAQKQWTLNEIESGEALGGLLCRLGV